mgnify:CR=1 FL=1
MKYIISAFVGLSLCAVQSFAFPQVPLAELLTDKLPVVSEEDFAPGNRWTWDYFDKDEELYSSETYTVLENEDGLLLFEMSTEFPDATQDRIHHRLQVDLNKCLASYKNPADMKVWSIKLHAWNGSQWIDAGVTNTLAFEEKFNCNPNVGRSSVQWATLFRGTERGELFQLQVKTRLASSWFFHDGENAAIQAEKTFVRSHGVSFTSRLRETEPLDFEDDWIIDVRLSPQALQRRSVFVTEPVHRSYDQAR